MRIVACILGILSGLSSLPLTFLVHGVVLIGSQRDAAAVGLGQWLYLGWIPLASIIGATMAIRLPALGGLLMLASSGGLLIIGQQVGAGTYIFSGPAMILSGLGGLFALLAGVSAVDKPKNTHSANGLLPRNKNRDARAPREPHFDLPTTAPRSHGSNTERPHQAGRS